jgi:D-glycero-alpha-D-manno-heptose 1-phosphate guanylyltransferase
MRKKEAIILAGGLGTRLQSEVPDLPKPMAPVNAKPFLEYLLSYLKYYGFTRVIISTGYLSEKISKYFGTSYNGIKLIYAQEEKPLGTGGALKFALQSCEEQHVLVLNGDSYFDIDLKEFELFHLHYSAMFSIATREVENASRYGTIETEEDEIKAFREKTGEEKPGLINAGIYYVDNYFFLENSPEEETFSLEKDFFEKNVDNFGFFSFKCDGYFIDIGIPEDYKRAQDEFKEFKYK